MSATFPTLDQSQVEAYGTSTPKASVFAEVLSENYTKAQEAAKVLSLSRNAQEAGLEAIKDTPEVKAKLTEIQAKIDKLEEAKTKLIATKDEFLTAKVADYVGDALKGVDTAKAEVQYTMALSALKLLQNNIGDEVPSLKSASFPTVKQLVDGKSGTTAKHGNGNDGPEGWRPRLQNVTVDGNPVDADSLNKIAPLVGVSAGSNVLHAGLFQAVGGRNLVEGTRYSFDVTKGDTKHVIAVEARVKPAKEEKTETPAAA